MNRRGTGCWAHKPHGHSTLCPDKMKLLLETVINPAGKEKGKLVTATKIEAGKFLAQCRECGRWQEVSPKHLRCEGYFEEWQADFCCCDRNQTAVFVLEKDYLDFH
jgi:hypothetical protein